VAAAWDLARRRIPNAVVAATGLAGLVVQVVDRGALAAGSGLAAAMIVIGLLYRPWTAGGIGGGDVKLAAAVAIWVGLGGLIGYVLGTAAAGGLVALGAYLLSARGVRREIRTNLALAAVEQSLPPAPPQAPGRVGVPYGVAIAVGAAIALWRT
jgi:prepilin peptidase CpaA